MNLLSHVLFQVGTNSCTAELWGALRLDGSQSRSLFEVASRRRLEVSRVFSRSAFLGVYILADAFENPVAAQAVALIGAAFVIALASIILYYLFKPRRNPHALRKRRRVRENSPPVTPTMERPRLQRARTEELTQRRASPPQSFPGFPKTFPKPVCGE